ncbi:hypothetical protein [Streptomyces sp. SID13726]|uniref:hypothetical protein n=1 Tax=Streptomyces sp. SID13726 TaxID=2706058 RepID=UPI00194463D6|nr:hypothetical protein [Streptomyces sp. SID13726]
MSDDDPQQALNHYESARIDRTTLLQQVSHARRDVNHLADGHRPQAGISGPAVRTGFARLTARHRTRRVAARHGTPTGLKANPAT